MGKKSKKGTTKAGKGRPGAGKAKQTSQSNVGVKAVQPTTTTTTKAPVVNVQPVAVLPSVAAVPRTLVPTSVKDETLSPVSVTDNTADEPASYDGEGHLLGKPNAYLSVSEASLPDDIQGSFLGEKKQKLPSVSFSNDVVLTESNDTSNCNIETSLPVEPTVTARDDVLISESYDASRSVIEVCLSSPEDVMEQITDSAEEEKKETSTCEEPTKDEVAAATGVSLSSTKLDDILTETTEDFFAAKESPLRKEFGHTEAPQNDDQLVAAEATETEAESVPAMVQTPPDDAAVVAPEFPEPSEKLEPPQPADNPETSDIAAKAAVEVSLDSLKVEKASVGAGNVDTAPTAAAAEVPTSRDASAAVKAAATATAAAKSSAGSLTEPGPSEKGEKQQDCCIIL